MIHLQGNFFDHKIYLEKKYERNPLVVGVGNIPELKVLSFIQFCIMLKSKSKTKEMQNERHFPYMNSDTVMNHTEKSSIESYYKQFSKKNKIKV